MPAYILRRLVLMLPLIIVISLFVFLLGQVGARDLAMELTLRTNDNSFDPEVYMAMRARFDLDEPPLVQFASFLYNALRGDFGVSYLLPGTPEIAVIIRNTLGISIQLGLAALFWLVVLGVPLGVITALGRNTVLDYGIVGLVTILSSIPTFVFAPVALVLLVAELQILPTVGFGWHGIFAVETILPSLLLAMAPLDNILRHTRTAIIDTLSEDYIRTARAKGLRSRAVLMRHALRNAFTPVLTQLGLAVGGLLTGSIFIETIFGIRGFGEVTVTAFQGGDVRVVAATTLVSAVIVMLVNLLVDLLYGLIDPRVRYTKA